MNTNSRRENILSILKSSSKPISASALAEQFKVSRQIIVGDIALLRASGHQISATPRGYIYQAAEHQAEWPYEGILACSHTPDELLEELYTIVDFGGVVLDVTIDHSLYGQLSGILNIASRYDADAFVAKANQHSTAKPLSILTDGIHLHHIGCKDEESFTRIQSALKEKGFAL